MIGEHIRTLKGGRWNHAIDCGDETVIHLAEGVPGTARVLRSYRPEFVSGARLVEVVTHRERTFPADEVVARAYSRIADPTLAAMFRDSEAFADWCATGRIPAGPPNVAVAGSAAGPEPAATEPSVNPRAPRGGRRAGAAAKRRGRNAPARKTAARKGAARPKARASPKTKRGASKARPREIGKRRARAKRHRR